MPFQTRITRLPGHVLFEVAGPTSIRNFVELVSTVAQETVYWSDRNVIVDLREVQGDLTPTEQIFLGELVAQELAHLQRLASIVAPGQKTRNSEKAARRLGAQLRVFDSQDEAVGWIAAETDALDAPHRVA